MQSDPPAEPALGAAAAAEAAGAPPPSSPPMTKSALKRQRRQEAWQANKLARRAAEKDKRKQKLQQTRELVAQGLIEKPADSPTQRKKQKRREIGKEKEPHPATLCIDLDFDKLMSDKVTGARAPSTLPTLNLG